MQRERHGGVQQGIVLPRVSSRMSVLVRDVFWRRPRLRRVRTLRWQGLAIPWSWLQRQPRSALDLSLHKSEA